MSSETNVPNADDDWFDGSIAAATNEDGKYHLEADLDCPLCGEVLHGGECR